MELIERQAALDAVSSCGICIQKVVDIPTIDAEPLRKGRWLPDNNCYYEVRFVCSVCKESEIVPTTGFYKYSPIWNYCPNCGAKMDGGDDNAHGA